MIRIAGIIQSERAKRSLMYVKKKMGLQQSWHDIKHDPHKSSGINGGFFGTSPLHSIRAAISSEPAWLKGRAPSLYSSHMVKPKLQTSILESHCTLKLFTRSSWRDGGRRPLAASKDWRSASEKGENTAAAASAQVQALKLMYLSTGAIASGGKYRGSAPIKCADSGAQ